MFNFPVWVFVNLRERADDGYPYCFMTRGGHGSGIPETLPVFTTRDRASNIGVHEPFHPLEVDREKFREVLGEQREIEEIVLDMGTPEAVVYPINDVLKQFEE